MKEKDRITSIILITIGVALIALPFLTQIQRSIILIGIVPLWMGFYILLNSKNKS